MTPPTAAPPKLLTAEEYAELPDPADGRGEELVRGRVVTMPNPGLRHGDVCSEVNYLLRGFVKANGLGFVTSNDSGFVTERGPDTVRGPDVAFWGRTSYPTPPVGHGQSPPDLAVEVESPSDSHAKMFRKVSEYLRCGVRMVWVIDPEDRTVVVYRAGTNGAGPEFPVTLDENDTLDGSPVLPGFAVPVRAFFG